MLIINPIYNFMIHFLHSIVSNRNISLSALCSRNQLDIYIFVDRLLVMFYKF